jgi:hypothetical protein
VIDRIAVNDLVITCGFSSELIIYPDDRSFVELVTFDCDVLTNDRLRPGGDQGSLCGDAAVLPGDSGVQVGTGRSGGD